MNFSVKNYLLRQLGMLFILSGLLFFSVPVWSNVAAIIYLFWLPGSILTNFIKKGIKDSPWMTTIHSVALSVLFLLVGGLIMNTIGVIAGYPHPLQKDFLLPGFNIFLLMFIAIEAIFVADEPQRRTPIFPKFSKKLFPYLCFFLMPVLAIAGANILNNGEGNTVTMVFVLLVAAVILLLASKADKISQNVLISGIYFISVSLLLMTSMRGWHVTGYDVHKEFMVFQLAKSELIWKMENFQDAYNACLSITILPTIVSQFVNIPDEYIYKFLFQFIFALMPVALYKFARTFASARMAFLATIFCIVQPWFFQGMPTLIRQEFGILFFTLTMMVIFDLAIPKRMRFPLASAYGIGMVISHYSTTYIAIFLFFGVFAANTFLAVLNLKPKRTFFYPVSKAVRFNFIALLIISVLIWNSFVTHTSNNLSEFLEKSSGSVTEILTSDTLLASLKQLTYSRANEISLQDYAKKESTQFREDHAELKYYPDEAVQKYTLSETGFANAPAVLGNTVHKTSLTAFRLIKILSNNIFIIFGMLYLSYIWWKRKFSQSELILFTITGFVILFSLIVIPGALEEYNLERLYLQMLIVWSLVGTFGGFQILKSFVKKSTAYNLLAVIYVLLFLFYSGFIFNITGGPASIAMDNYGEEFEKFYTSEQDVQAAQWLGKNYNGEIIYTGSHGINKLTAYSTIPEKKMIRQTLPEIISKDSFVFATYINTVGNKATFDYNGNEYAYTYPAAFLDENKNEIYSNGTSKIYR